MNPNIPSLFIHQFFHTVQDSHSPAEEEVEDFRGSHE